MMILLFVLFIRSLISGHKNNPSRLFSAALRNENNGDFEEALVKYETALIEAKKHRSDKNLKNKILEKIKVLHTVIWYEKANYPG